jgi:hypothetical protein
MARRKAQTYGSAILLGTTAGASRRANLGDYANTGPRFRLVLLRSTGERQVKRKAKSSASS